MYDFKCPICGHKGQIEMWDTFDCACGNDLYWDESWDEESGECWEDMLWTWWSREAMDKAKKR